MSVWVRFAVLGFASAWCLHSSDAHAGMRCDGKIVSEGDSAFRVRDLCGAPDAEQRRVELRTIRRYVQGPCRHEGDRRICGYTEEISREVVIDEWVYDQGKYKFASHLTFEEGRLLSVRTGSYGRKDTAEE